ncbi:Hypothetical predicted protein [Olea europaea subsp. europaea]|uniref:Uncharacterized protein n=1 Tax=Olea europaea subsp. europaea TaxID=158383 RepID=A0A8S0REK8_OLEEU|nr:Hypothetical predicted protein [Olea europaea subsp. europaea]
MARPSSVSSLSGVGGPPGGLGFVVGVGWGAWRSIIPKWLTYHVRGRSLRCDTLAAVRVLRDKRVGGRRGSSSSGVAAARPCARASIWANRNRLRLRLRLRMAAGLAECKVRAPS